ncbi:hypothetical protein FKM82_023398 [Ascaphus truei]
MESLNQTHFTEFIILGFSNLADLQDLIFGIFLVVYLLTFSGNLTIIYITKCDPSLHKPMYFFLSNLSFLEMCYTSVTLPKMLQNLWTKNETISYKGCVTQLYFFVTFVGTECVLLSVMSYDRFVAICKPLRYSLIMSKKVCVILTSFSWLCGLMNSLVHSIFTFHLSFCHTNRINYFFCDIPPLLLLSCSDTSVNETVLLAAGAFIGCTPFLCIIVSYAYIILTILRIRTTKGRRKAFSTCTSHITVVVLYFGSVLFTYLRPISSYSMDKDRLIALLYSFLTPLLNPFIYTLKNKEVTNALAKACFKR